MGAAETHLLSPDGLESPVIELTTDEAGFLLSDWQGLAAQPSLQVVSQPTDVEKKKKRTRACRALT
jgi:hypothetical protein